MFCSSSFCLFMLLPFSLLGGWAVGRWAVQVGDGVGTNLADINFQDAQALPQAACEASRIMKMIFSSKQKINPKNTPSQTQSLILR